jgi:hypothetical protein
MSLFSWLRNRTSARPPRGRAQHRPAAPRFRPRLEALEGRALPSTYFAATASQLVADIGAANKAGGSNTIALTAPTTSPYVLTAAADGADGLPQISKKDSLTIVGNGDTIERSTAAGTPDFRLFNVAGKTGSLTLENLTLQNGQAGGYGGAVYNQGTLVLSQVTVESNTALSAAGGGIWSNGSLTVENSTIGGNVVNTGNWSQPAYGGGIYIAGGTATITGSTFGSNAAEGSTAYGGAVYIAAGTVTLSGDSLGYQSATFGVPPNSAEGWGVVPGDNGYGGALYVAGGSVTLTNDYVQGNAAFDLNSTAYLGPNGGGMFIASGATLYLDSFTWGQTTGNSPNNIWGGYTLLS